MRFFQTLIYCALLALLVLGGAPARAQSRQPLKTIDVQVGGYPLQVRGSKVRATAANGQKVLNVTLDVAAFKLVEEESSTTEEKTP